ncbi:MAG: hypothetical protein AAFW69_12540, partial [Pseudomonadota bacterium]
MPMTSPKSLRAPALATALLAALTACGPVTQSTSGAAYLAQTGADGSALEIDASIAEVAAVEPTLTFPARIGVARVVGSRLTALPEGEATALADFASRNAAYGTFVPISPLVAELVGAESEIVAQRIWGVRRVLSTIRRAAARQHLDAVLIYELGASGRVGNTTLAIADLTIIGGAI